MNNLVQYPVILFATKVMKNLIPDWLFLNTEPIITKSITNTAWLLS